jgi:type II secretory pathway component PulM
MSDKISPSSVREMLDAVQADRETRQVFLKMPREEQLLAILGMITFLTSEFAKLQKDNIEYRQERELKEKAREQREKKLVEILDTDPNIKALSPEEKQNTMQKIIALATRPARKGALLDKVLSLILVILFVLFVMGKLPIP